MIKLAIVGTGGIAHWHAKSFQNIEDVKIVGACDIDKERVNTFAQEYNIEKTYNSFDHLLEDCEFDAISNATPDPFHKEIALKAIKKNKHVFSEKPLAENYPDAKEMYEAIKDTNLINMVNFSYRNSSGYQELAKVVQSGKIGKVRHVDASYYQSWLTCKYWGDWKTQDQWLWRLSTAHGSMGTLGDIGVHIFDFASFPVGQIKSINSRLKTFKDKGEKIGQYVLDANDTFISMIEFDNGALGTVSATRFATGFKNRLDLKIFGELGAVKISFEDPIQEGNQYQITNDTERVLKEKSDKLKWNTIITKPTPNNFERFIESIKRQTNDQPNFQRGAEIQKILDACSESSQKNIWIDL
jgi:predicted dehydrogenase|tara:strand:+ start:482 stop:1549 length:1068 start_codon:yes stop_codon:yes gene_type:complete